MSMDLNMDTGKRIKERRRKLGLTAEDVANKIGVSAGTIYRYESKYINNMGIDKLSPIAQALDTTEAYLMGLTDNPNRPEASFSKCSDFAYMAEGNLYFMETSQAIARTFYERPELKILFNLLEKLSSDEVNAITQVVRFMNGNNK